MQVRRYASRLSGPLLDRVDLHLGVRPVRREALLGEPEPESSAVVATRVAQARAAAAERWRPHGWRLNAEIPGSALRGRYRPSREAMAPVSRALDDGRVTARGVDRVLRVAWTLADLAGRQGPGRPELAAALRFRSADQAAAA
jgi:magnesium chelatase family protein